MDHYTAILPLREISTSRCIVHVRGLNIVFPILRIVSCSGTPWAALDRKPNECLRIILKPISISPSWLYWYNWASRFWFFILALFCPHFRAHILCIFTSGSSRHIDFDISSYRSASLFCGNPCWEQVFFLCKTILYIAKPHRAKV